MFTNDEEEDSNNEKSVRFEHLDGSDFVASREGRNS